MSELRDVIDSIQKFDASLKSMLTFTKKYLDSLEKNEVFKDSKNVIPHLLNMIEIIESWDSKKRSKQSFDEFIHEIDECCALLVGHLEVLYINGRPGDKIANQYKMKLNEITNFLSSDMIYSYRLMLDLSNVIYSELGVNKNKIREQCNKSLEDIKIIRSNALELKEEFEKVISDVPDIKESFTKQMSSAAQSVTAAATNHVGSTIAATYRLNAQKENKIADWFRIGSISCFAVSAAIILYGLYNNSAAPHSFVELIYRTGPILFFTIPAFYLARESNAHRAAQRKFQHLALNLPIGIKYVRGLDENSRRGIEAEFAKHLLMNSENTIGTNNQASSTGIIDELSLRSILSDLKAAVEQIPKP